VPVEVGAYVWLPCEVKPGPFSNERMVRVASESGYWVGFVPAHSLKEPITVGTTLIRALVIDVQGDRLTARPPGESLSSTLLLTDLSRVESVDSVEAGHS
jgi:hypothetical protein